MDILVQAHMMEGTILNTPTQTTISEITSENWHKCECHYIEKTRLLCKRCDKCIQRGAIVYGYKMTRIKPKVKKAIEPSDSHTKLEEIENVAQWVKHQKIVHKSLPKDKTKWDEEVFRREHPSWVENPKKKNVTLNQLLGRACEKCDEPVPILSKLDLCEMHRKEHRREVVKLAVQRFRARQKVCNRE